MFWYFNRKPEVHGAPSKLSPSEIWIFGLTAVLGVFLSILVLFLRVNSAISFLDPLQLQTSGDEVSSIFLLWKYSEGLSIYTSRFDSPFNLVTYNWLFYYFYGAFTQTVLNIFALNNEWIPTIGRLLSLVVGILGVSCAYCTFKRKTTADLWYINGFALMFAVYAVVGPLTGFWIITVRPDIAALTCEIIATLLFLKNYPKNRLLAVLLLILMVYLAWSFKQVNVFAAGGAGLLLLFRREWKYLLILSSVLPTGWLITFIIGDTNWAEIILLKDLPLTFTWERLGRNLANFALKTGPIWFHLGALFLLILLSRFKLKELWHDNSFLFGFCASVCGIIIAVPLSSQSGGAENYFFTLNYFLSLCTISSLSLVVENNNRYLRYLFLSGWVGWVALAVSLLCVLNGWVGVVNTRPQHEKYTLLKECADTLPRPLYFHDTYMGLPWMTPNNISYVISYVYQADRDLKREFEYGGIGGLINEGTFETLVFPEKLVNRLKAPMQKFDGGSLKAYVAKKTAECPNFYVFSRITKKP